MENTQIGTLIQESLKDTDFNDLDVLILIMKKRTDSKRSVSTLSDASLLRLVVELRNEMDTFRAELKAMNEASERTNRSRLVKSLLS